MIPQDAEVIHLQPVLQVERLSIRLPAGADRALAVDTVDLSIDAGRTLCVVGESGSGKSMIASAVIGLLPRNVATCGGRVLFEGRDLLLLEERQLRELRGRRIAMVFQEPMTSLNPLLRVGEQIGEVLDAHAALTPAERSARIVGALADVGLPDPATLAESYPFRLSGGQRQRVMIAAAMVLEPSLLVADEPTTALDVTTQAQILTLMRELQQRKGMSMLFITHDFGVVAQIADEVAVMQTGRMVERGPAREVLAHPQHAYTRALIEAIPHGTARAQEIAARASAPLLAVEAIGKTYRSGGGLWRVGREVAAARGVSFTLRQGETLGLVGESGSGKSTVGRCIAGLAPVDTGRICYAGRELAPDVRQRPIAERARIQMVFQDPYASLNPRHRVGAAIAAGPIEQGVAKAEARERALELLGKVGLSADAAERYPHEFSGGQRQRIAIARALASRPQLLVADEPVSALDVSVQAQVLALLEQIRREFDLAMLFITHDLRVAAQMCDRIAVMRRGEIVELGETAALLGQPQHPYTRELLAAAPRFRSSLEAAAA